MKRGQSGINCLVAIDKPVGMSSHDVVNRVRRSLGERRVGHAGTLDPAASGVLVVGVGQGTRLMGLLSCEAKSYEALIAFGAETDTDDAEGEVTRLAAVPRRLRSAEGAEAIVRDLVGPHDQVPPSFSAISVNGERAYRRARSGQTVKIAPRHIEILGADLLAVESAEALTWRVALTVSKGTYIRSIARDLGREQGTAAHLSALRRTASGAVGLGNCLSLDELQKHGARALSGGMLDPASLLGLPVRQVGDAELASVLCGRALPAGASRAGGAGGQGPASSCERVALVRDAALVGIWRRSGHLLRCDVNFPAGIAGVCL